MNFIKQQRFFLRNAKDRFHPTCVLNFVFHVTETWSVKEEDVIML